MSTEENKHLGNLENQEIDGKTVLGGGSGDIDHNDVPNAGLGGGMTEIGPLNDTIQMETPMPFQTDALPSDDAPPMHLSPGMDNTSGFSNGNT